jgi:hypothetical protein
MDGGVVRMQLLVCRSLLVNLRTRSSALGGFSRRAAVCTVSAAALSTYEGMNVECLKHRREILDIRGIAHDHYNCLGYCQI